MQAACLACTKELMKAKKKDELPHYWICAECAEKKGGKMPVGHICTVCHDKCEYCGKEDTVIPIRDFRWPPGVY